MPSGSGAPLATAGPPLKAPSAGLVNTASSGGESFSNSMGAQNEFAADFGEGQYAGGTRTIGDEDETQNQTYTDNKISTSDWVLMFVVAAGADIIGIIPIIGSFTSPVAVAGMHQWTSSAQGNKATGLWKWLPRIISFALGVSEIVPGISSFLPGATGVVLTAFLTSTKIGRLAVVAGAAIATGGAAAGAAGGAAAGGAGAGAAAGAGTAGAGGAGATAAAGAQTMTGSLSAGSSSAASEATVARNAASKGPGVGEQYRSFKRYKDMMPSRQRRQETEPEDQGEDQQDILERVMENAEQEEFFPGSPIELEGLYADAPEQQTSQRNNKKRQDKNVSSSKKLKPQAISPDAR